MQGANHISLSQETELMHTLSAISAACPSVGRKLMDFSERSLRAYANELFGTPGLYSTCEALPGREHFRAALATTVPSGISQSELDVAFGELEQGAPIQTGPHCQCLLEPTTLGSLLLMREGARQRRYRYVTWYGCSTVTLESRSRCGPGWIVVPGRTLNAFGLSRKTLARSSVCARRLSVKWADETRIAIAGLMGAHLLDRSVLYRSPADAFRSANTSLWNRLEADGHTALLQLDDRFCAELVARHIEDKDSPIHHIVLDPRFVGIIEKERAEIRAESPCHHFPWSTDFFWYCGPSRIERLSSSGKLLRGVRSGIEFSATGSELVRGLRAGQLLPNLFLSFLCMSLLTGFGVVGGPLQILYLPNFASVASRLFEQAGLLPLTRRVLTVAGPNHGLGMCVVDPGHLATPDGIHASFRDSSIVSMSLQEVSDRFSIFRRQRVWVTLNELFSSHVNLPPGPYLPQQH